MSNKDRELPNPTEHEKAPEGIAGFVFKENVMVGRFDPNKPTSPTVAEALEGLKSEISKVDEELTPPTKEDYRRAYDELEAMVVHDKSFNVLLGSVPEDRPEIREAIRGLWYHKPDKLLNPEKMAKLKTENPDLYKEVDDYYLRYLEGKLSIEE